MIQGCISVIIPTYNRFEMLKQAIGSVVMQDYHNIEIIVVDDHSSDGTECLTTFFPDVRYFRNDVNRGPGYNRKFGLQQSSGEFVVFLDDDDYYTDARFFSKAVEVLCSQREQSLAFAAANAQILHVEDGSTEDKELNIAGYIDRETYLKGFASEYDKPLSTFTSVFSKNVLMESGIMKMEMVNDMAIYLRSLLKGNAFILKDFVGVYRVHAQNISKNIRAQFLIDNLEEKYYVYQKIKEQKLFFECEKWWEQQITTTVDYYIYGSKPSIGDAKKVRRWCLEHMQNKAFVLNRFKKYKAFLIDCKVCKIKCGIKKVLGLK